MKERDLLLELSLPPVADAIPEARRSLDALAGELSPQALEDARLLVSELVTNSIRHGELRAGQRVLLRAEVEGAVIRIEVTDEGHGFELKPRSPGDTGSSGWGLFLVGRIADRWGMSSDGSTRVWFEIDRARASADSGRFGQGITG
ncbi:MAG TPA: ATP-binding protein [Actinomycetota bacterium]|jgi:anti-sigma regulatory factor (Ser/Thr protein kinase)|nr:ATP-binding protein [Actinomycetota bacterium]